MSLKLYRPRILTRAAKAGAEMYRRERDLARVAPRVFAKATRKSPVVADLAAAEAECEAERKEGAVTYSIGRHISLLAALFAEARAAQA